MTGIFGAIAEAWSELRIHRTRVLLSLIGVGIAVAALTLVTALGAMVQQSQTETYERQAGRPAMLQLSVYDPMTGESPDPEALDAAYTAAMERYGISYWSRNTNNGWMVQFPDGVSDVSVMVVDPDFGTMHRVLLKDGRWFTDRDTRRLAPAVIVNDWMWKRLGSPPLDSHPTITVPGVVPMVGVIVGVTPTPVWEEYASMYILWDAYAARLSPADLENYGPPIYEAWVPPELADELMGRIGQDVGGALGEPFLAEVYRTDYLTWGEGEDPLLPLKLMVGGVGALILLLGALGLLTISIVTVRYRIREIGIRRSFGATSGRIFFAVMMESVVATFVAGAVGVIVAIMLTRLPIVQEYLLQGAQDVPPFPWESVVIGLTAATAVGALAGLMPAVIAVRVKVIDAIRF